jgi:hypothetical protein
MRSADAPGSYPLCENQRRRNREKDLWARRGGRARPGGLWEVLERTGLGRITIPTLERGHGDTRYQHDEDTRSGDGAGGLGWIHAVPPARGNDFDS